MRSEVNPPLSWYAGLFGALTTPFKRLGVYGWSDTNFVAVATGEVEHASESTDRFLTVDMQLHSLIVNSTLLPLRKPKFIRAEICLADVKLDEDRKPKPKQEVKIAGRLMWDGDGFLEVHPRDAEDIVIVPSFDVRND